MKYSKFQAARILLEAGANPDYIDSRGRTALHCMLAKNSDLKYYRMFVEHGARGDIADRSGKPAAEIMRRKRDKRYHAIANQLALG